MIVNGKEDIDALIKIGKIVAEIREVMLSFVKVGISTFELDRIGMEIMDKYKVESAPMKDYDFPGYTCISVNHIAAHGIPSNYKLKAGDMINIDVSCSLNGYYADTGASIVVKEKGQYELQEKLCKSAEKALYSGIAAAKIDNKIYEIGRRIFSAAKDDGFTVIMNLTGHGIGKKLHESPKAISNYYCKSENQTIKKGQVLAIETFVSNGSKTVQEGGDGWSLKTVEGGLVAQYEHTIIVTEGQPIIITL